MNKVKNQHYVPQFYLKQWTNNKEQLFVYDKKQKKSFRLYKIFEYQILFEC